MNTRKIAYIEPGEDTLQKEVDWALSVSEEERLQVFFRHLAINYALAGIDIYQYQPQKNIYYLDDKNAL